MENVYNHSIFLVSPSPLEDKKKGFRTAPPFAITELLWEWCPKFRGIKTIYRVNDVFISRLACALTPHHSSSARVTPHPDSTCPVFLQKYPCAEILKTTVPGSFWKSMELYSQRFLGFARWMLEKSSKTIPQHFALMVVSHDRICKRSPTKQTKVYRLYLAATKMAPENGWLEYDRFFLGRGLFSEAMMPVSGSRVTFRMFSCHVTTQFCSSFSQLVSV